MTDTVGCKATLDFSKLHNFFLLFASINFIGRNLDGVLPVTFLEDAVHGLYPLYDIEDGDLVNRSRLSLEFVDFLWHSACLVLDEV